MSDCCGTTRDGAARACGSCATEGRPIRTLTVKSLVRDHTRVCPDAEYWLCRSQGCDVVYFSAKDTFRKQDLKVRVGFKEQQNPIPLCYCFDYTSTDISRDLALHGETDVPEKIKEEIQRGFCACEVKNPSGQCCLGDVYRAVKELTTAAVSGS